MFLGASPEILVSKLGGYFEAHALAGTVARATDEQTDKALATRLHNDDKLIREHAVVVEDIRDALQPLSEQLTEAGPTTIQLRDVQHLRTNICGRARPGCTLLQAVDALHPTPALGGYPREAAANTFDRPSRWSAAGMEGPLVGSIKRVMAYSASPFVRASCSGNPRLSMLAQDCGRVRCTLRMGRNRAQNAYPT